MSRHIVKLFKAPLVLASAALVIHISAATAADSNGDIQQQVREMLTGTTTAHFVPQAGVRDGQAKSPAADSQEFVKQLLLGTSTSRVADTEAIKHTEVAGASDKTEPQRRPVAREDMQTTVRQLLLGQAHASPAS